MQENLKQLKELLGKVNSELTTMPESSLPVADGTKKELEQIKAAACLAVDLGCIGE